MKNTARATLRGNRLWFEDGGLEPVSSPIRIAVVGLGPRGRHHAIPKCIAYQEYDLRAVCDVRPELVQAATESIPGDGHAEVTGYTNYDEMLEREELDAVALLVDVDRQIPLACRAMKKGLHVMCEVPLTYSMDDCWDIVTTVEQTGKTFFMMEQVRYAGYVEAYRNIVKSGALGKPVFAEGEYFHYLPARFFQDDEGTSHFPEAFGENPAVKPTWRCRNPVIGYLPHDLSPLLYILDDRVTRVVGMANRKRSYKHANMEYCDTQAALMHTEKDVVMRLAAGFSTVSLSRMEGEYGHWQHIKCTDGILEGPRKAGDQHTLYIPGWQMKNAVAMPWGLQRSDAPPAAAGSGHGDLDFYVFALFADAVLHALPLAFDVYRAVETAAPAILAAASIDNDNAPLDVPDFRPGPHREPGERPAP